MTSIVPGTRSVEDFVLNRRDRHRRAQAELLEFAEIAEARRLSTRIQCGRRLTDLATDELVAQHQCITDRAAGDPGLELDLRDFERVLKRGCEHLLAQYMYGRW
jgi:hypothetical protein